MAGWIGVKIKKGKSIGKVINDSNGMYRILTVLFSDNNYEEEIVLNNVGENDPKVKKYKWYYKKTGKWYNF